MTDTEIREFFDHPDFDAHADRDEVEWLYTIRDRALDPTHRSHKFYRRLVETSLTGLAASVAAHTTP